MSPSMPGRRRAVTLLGVVALLAAGCGASGSRGLSRSPTTSAPPATPSERGSFVKPLLLGLIDKGSELAYHLSQSFPLPDLGEVSVDSAAFGGIVVNETWAQLEPRPGVIAPGDLESALASVETYDSAHPSHQLGVKIRLWAGYTAPSWAKDLGGPPIVVPGAELGGGQGTLGHWWQPSYRDAWSHFLTLLANHFDTDPLVQEIAVSSCNTTTDEPFIMNASVARAALAAGWTSTDQKQCLDGALGDYASWKHTALDFTFNPLAVFSSSKARSVDFTFTESLMSRCAAMTEAAGGQVCIVDNHGLSDTVAPRAVLLYDEIDALFAASHGLMAVTFQTIGPGGFSLCGAVAVAVAHHARSIEAWPPGAHYPGFSQYSPAELTAWSSALRNGRPPSCS